MKKTVSEYQFTEDFNRLRPNSYSYEGLKALFNYFEEYEESTGEEIELDVIGICCEFTEYENLKEFQSVYSEDFETFEDIENETQLINIDDESFIILDF